jgi:5-methylcytosine-specific restriction protein A
MNKPRLKTLPSRIQEKNLSKVRTSIQTVRLTGSRWIAIKKSFEIFNPRLCAECNRQGLVGNGDELDHIVPLWSGGSNSLSNLQWLCIEHHIAKTKEEAKQRSEQ